MRKNLCLNRYSFFIWPPLPPKQCWVVVWTFIYIYDKFQHYRYQTYIRQTTNSQTGRKTDMRTDRQTTGDNEKKLFLFFYQKVILNIWANSPKNFNIVWGGGGILLTFSYIKKCHFCTQISKIPNYFAHYCVQNQ